MQSILQITNYHPLLGNRERVKRKKNMIRLILQDRYKGSGHILLNPNSIASIQENPNDTSTIKMNDGETFVVYNSIKAIEKNLEEDKK